MENFDCLFYLFQMLMRTIMLLLAALTVAASTGRSLRVIAVGPVLYEIDHQEQ